MKKITRLLLLSMLVCLTAVGNIFAQEVKDAPGKLNLQQGHVTYQVGNQAINFYDDGGKEAPYSKEPFDGAVTFIPKDPSQKISINLHSIDVYWSEFAAKMGKTSDILIYNGRDTVGTPSAEIKDEKSGIYVSQANDGSLTVRFRSTRNGNNAGWEALVKQIPADTPMSVNKIAIDNVYNKWSIPKLDILTKHYSIFKVNIITEGIKPISLNNLKIAATQSYFDKAYLYKGNSKEIVEQPIATLNVKGNKDFNFETNVPLQTGNNYFYVVVDTDETVKDQSVKFSLSDLNVGTLTLEDATKKGLVKTTEEGQVFQTDPKLKFKLGHLTVPLDKEGYSILSEQKSAYSTSYNSAAGDRIITFVSQEEGMVVSCKFDEFNIGFNPYEKKNPSLTFYNGTKAEGEPIVAINNESEAQSYVGKDIRSNGKALTVKFTTVGELTKKIAFRGTVNLYKPEKMQAKSLTVETLTDEIAAPGKTNLRMLGLSLAVEGNLSPISLEKLSIDLRGSDKLLHMIKVFVADKDFNFNDENLLAAKLIKEGDKEVVFSQNDLAQAPKLKEEGSYLIVLADVRDNAPNGSIQLGIKEAAAGGKAFDLINPNPEGEVLVRNIFLQPKAGKVEKVISSPIHYYPDQGKGMKATNKIKSTVTFIPKNPNEKVTLHINEMTISTSRFDVYSGKDDKGKLLFEGKFKTTARGNKLDDILSDSEDGALTIVFEAKNVRTIWDIEVKTVVPKDRAIESINAKTTISKDFKGSLKGGSQELLKLEVGVAGDINETSLGKVTFETSDNITSGKIYSTGVQDKFSASEEIATAEAKDGKCVFDLSSKKLDKSTNYYFWFVANISKDAKPEDVISAKLISADPAVSDLTTETATTKVVKGISGNFVIGNSDKADFKTIQEAFDSLKEGIDGPVVFAMEDGTYDSDNAVLQNVPGTSDNNTITLTSQSKDRKKVVIEGVKSNIVDYNSPHQGTITISNLNFLTINDLTFKTDDEKYTANILIKDHSNNITIDRCDVITTNQGNDIRGVKLEVRESYINNCNNFTLTNSYIEGGHIGVEIEGIGYVAETPAFNALVKNNVIKDAASKALYINSFSDFIIEDNQIEMKNANGNTLECIAIVKGMGSDSRISRNKISIIEPAKHISGICFRGFNENDNAFYRKNAHLFVDNNILHMKDVKANSMAIEFDRRSSSTNIDFVYNTVVIEGQECESSIALQMMANNKMENIRIINNIILNKANGFVYSMNGDKLNSSVSFRNNAVFAINKDHFAYFTNKEYTTKTFDTWVEATGDKDSKVENVSFVNAGLFLPKKKDQVNFALPIKDVTTDIAGTERDTNTPSVGAYEAKFNVPDNAPTLIKYAIENIKGESASFNVTADQMATISYMVLKSDLEAPSSEEIKAKGKKASLDSNKEISISIDHLEIETEYKVYAIITGALNQLETTPETLTFETIANPVETSNFDDNQKINEIEGGFISGSNKFVGFEIAEDPNNEPWDTNQVAKMTGNEATIYVINTKKAIEQAGFFMANEKEVTITAIREDNLKGETVVDIMTVEPSDNEFYYIQSAKLGKVRAIKLQSQGEVYIDNFNGDPKPMQLIMKDGGAVKGQKGTVEVIVKDGLSPYTYEWENGTKTAKNEIVAEKTSKIKVKVTDAQGKEAEGFAYFVVAEAQDGFKVATFENLEVPEALYFNNQRFVDEQYLFNNNFNEAYKSWSGFAYTSAKDSTFTSWDNGTDQYNVVAKGGYNSEKYAVGYPGMPDGSRISVAAGDLKTTIKGTMMTLTAYTYTFFKEGQGDQSSVKEGDFFFVTIKGDNGNKKDVYLVDYRDDKKFMMTDWTWVDLSELGDVNTLTFSTTGSRKNDWGDVVPGYFAIDNFNCDKPNDVSAKVPFSSQVRAYLADGKIFVKDAEGYTIKLHAMDGSLVNEFVAASNDEVRDANLPEGTYIMVAHKGTEVVRQKLIMR